MAWGREKEPEPKRFLLLCVHCLCGVWALLFFLLDMSNRFERVLRLSSMRVVVKTFCFSFLVAYPLIMSWRFRNVNRTSSIPPKISSPTYSRWYNRCRGRKRFCDHLLSVPFYSVNTETNDGHLFVKQNEKSGQCAIWLNLKERRFPISLLLS